MSSKPVLWTPLVGLRGSEWQLFLYYDRRRQKLFKDTMRMRCTVLLTISRLTTRIQHRAVELAGTGGLKKVLFPTGTSPTPSHAPPMELRSDHPYSHKSDFKYTVQNLVADELNLGEQRTQTRPAIANASPWEEASPSAPDPNVLRNGVRRGF